MEISSYKYDLFWEQSKKMAERSALGFSLLEETIHITAIAMAEDDDVLDSEEAMLALKKKIKRMPKHESKAVLDGFFEEWKQYSKDYQLLPAELLKALDAGAEMAAKLLSPSPEGASSPAESAQ